MEITKKCLTCSKDFTFEADIIEDIEEVEFCSEECYDASY